MAGGVALSYRLPSIIGPGELTVLCRIFLMSGNAEPLQWFRATFKKQIEILLLSYLDDLGSGTAFPAF